jgi:hypothetical protein
MFKFNLERPLRYVLDGHEPKVSTLTEADPDYFRGICETIATNNFGHEAIGVISVSTIFLGIDHARRGPPILFETMIFDAEGGIFNGYQTRCCTWDEAMQMHADAIEHVKNAFQELAKASGA